MARHSFTHHCQKFSVREVDLGRVRACGVGETGVFTLSWGLCSCMKGSTGGGTPIGAPRPLKTRIGRRSCSQMLPVSQPAMHQPLAAA